MATAEPLVATDVETPGENTPLRINPGEQPLKDLPESTRREQAVAGLAAVSFATSIASIIFSSSPVVYVSGIIGAGLSPYAAVQQRKITDVAALAETNKRVEEEVEQLKGENDKLQAQVQALGASVEGLKASKEKLDIIQSVQGQSLDELEKQLVESRSILDTMKADLAGDMLQNLISVVLAADDNGDSLLSDVEIDEITKNIESLQGIDLPDGKMKQLIIAKGRSISALMDMIKTVIQSEDIEAAIKSFKEDIKKIDRGLPIGVAA